MFPGKNVPRKNAPWKIAPGKLSPRKIDRQKIANSPWIFFANFFLSLAFIFMIIIVHKKDLFPFN